MKAVYRRLGLTIMSAAVLMAALPAPATAAAEVFTATATVKTADGKSGSAPITVTIDRTMSKDEASGLVAAFKSGGAAALRKALVGVAPTGSVRVGQGKVTPTRFTIEREVGGGRLLTIVTDQPLVFIGGAKAGAKPKAGYDFAVVDLQVDASGSGSGTVAPAATLKLNGDALVVEDYSGEVVRLTAVKKGS
jgi:hypothetical protein